MPGIKSITLFNINPLVLIAALVIALCCSCKGKINNNHPERAFYYWKSVVKLSDFERIKSDSLNIKTIYLKFFDVDWNNTVRQAVPVAKMQVKERYLLQHYKIIPTVFITNECFRQMDSLQAIALAGSIYTLVQKTCAINEINQIEEIQIDCDWTVATAVHYFALLRKLKELSNLSLSATIRLHQVKFSLKTGIPPVDRGLLMCYNMGNLKNPETINSIIEPGELEKYIQHLSAYPLPLDIALPLFEWKVLFRNNIYKGLIENLPTDIFTPAFSLSSGNKVEVFKDTLLEGYDLKKGDLLRIEESDLSSLTSVIKILNKQLRNTPGRLSLYHLDSVPLKKFTTHELESIYNGLH